MRMLRVQNAVRESGYDGIVLTTDVNIFYLTGLVFTGYLYLPSDNEPLWFVKRPCNLSGERIFIVHKPEMIPEILVSQGYTLPSRVLLETDVMPFNECTRLMAALKIEMPAVGNASVLMRRLRMVKTGWEIEQFRKSALGHVATYSKIPSLYRKGMTDARFQAEIEHVMRMNGSIGVFRFYGSGTDIFMGSLLAGANAEAASPFDFALGGAGLTTSCPIGANGTVLREGMAVMVDMVGNYTDYLTDMTRVYSIGRLPELAYKAHQTSIDIHAAFMEAARPAVSCASLYELAVSIVDKAGLAPYFMGTVQQAKFVGHGIGIEINEPPVLTPRSKEALAKNMTIALEPKFVIPAVGAVGIENSYLVTDDGVEKLTVFPEEIIELPA